MNVGAAQQLCELREQYARLQDDYKSKLCEVSRLRSDAEALRRESREAREERERLEIRLMDAQERARAIEAERNDLLGQFFRFVLCYFLSMLSANCQLHARRMESGPVYPIASFSRLVE